MSKAEFERTMRTPRVSRTIDANLTRHSALPEAGQKQLAALTEKDSTLLLKPHPAAPAPFPKVPVGVSVRLSTEVTARITCPPPPAVGCGLTQMYYAKLTPLTPTPTCIPTRTPTPTRSNPTPGGEGGSFCRPEASAKALRANS